jgi:hypothetical protein
MKKNNWITKEAYEIIMKELGITCPNEIKQMPSALPSKIDDLQKRIPGSAIEDIKEGARNLSAPPIPTSRQTDNNDRHSVVSPVMNVGPPNAKYELTNASSPHQVINKRLSVPKRPTSRLKGYKLVIHEFKSEEPGDLELRLGEEVLILAIGIFVFKLVDEYWYEGENFRGKGIFPKAYVQ